MPSVTVTFGGDVVGEYPVDKPVVVVGREATCEIHIDNLGVSRTHCQFIKRGQNYVLQDMNSANGTYVNGKRIGEHYLNDGDEILVGKHTLKFNAHGTVSEAAPAQAGTDDQLQDALHTYVMDGARIRERLAEMHAAPGEAEAAAPPGQVPGTSRLAAVTGPAPKTAKDHAVDFDPLKPQGRKTAAPPSPRPVAAPAAGGGGIKAMLYLSLGTNVILIVLIVMLILFLMKLAPQTGTDRPGGAAPAPASAPAAGRAP